MFTFLLLEHESRPPPRATRRRPHMSAARTCRHATQTHIQNTDATLDKRAQRATQTPYAPRQAAVDVLTADVAQSPQVTAYNVDHSNQCDASVACVASSLTTKRLAAHLALIDKDFLCDETVFFFGEVTNRFDSKPTCATRTRHIHIHAHTKIIGLLFLRALGFERR